MSDRNAILAEAVSCGNTTRRGHVEAELLERDAMSDSFILGPCVGDDMPPPA